MEQKHVLRNNKKKRAGSIVSFKIVPYAILPFTVFRRSYPGWVDTSTGV